MHNGLSTNADRLLTIVQATYEWQESDHEDQENTDNAMLDPGKGRVTPEAFSKACEIHMP